MEPVIWPRSIRLIHWSLAVIVILNAFILVEGDPPHRYLGYVAVALVLIRMVLGFTGKGHSQFKNFPIKPRLIKEFILALAKGKHLSYPGHNPLASIVYFGIWILVIALGITGQLMMLDQFWGNQLLEDIHEIFSILLLICVGIHLIGIAIDARVHRRKSWMAMINGKKEKFIAESE